MLKSAKTLNKLTFRSFATALNSKALSESHSGINQTQILTPEESKTVSKLIEKDYQYFVNLSEKIGMTNILTSLNEISGKYDASTVRGRELLAAKEEAIMRLTYNERSVEEHQNLSIHICEKDLYRTYRIHMQELEAKSEKSLNILKSMSTNTNKKIYIRNGSLLKYNHLFSPSLIFLLPSFYIFTNSAFLKLTLGVYSPHLLMFSAAYIAYRRYKFLTGSSYSKKENYIISSLEILNESLLRIETVSPLKKVSFDMDLRYISIEKHENELRRNHYYTLLDEITQKKFVLLVDELCHINEKALNFFASKKCIFGNSNKDIYDVKKIILEGDNLIDLSHKSSESIETLARISILNMQFGNISHLSQEDLYEKISLIPDKQVKEYLKSIENSIKSITPMDEALMVEVANLFVGLGLMSDEANQITSILISSLYVKNLKDLKGVSDQNLNEIFLKVNVNFHKNYPNFIEKLKILLKEI